MNFMIAKTILYESLSHFQSVVEKRNTIPILSNIKLKTGEDKIEITATDLAIEMSERIDAKVISPGELTLPSQLLFDIIRKIPEKSEIEIKEHKETGRVFILFGDSKFSLPFLPSSDFPEMESENFENNFVITADKFKYLLDGSKFSMGVDESRQYLNGVFLSYNNDMITTVATDGHRLSKCQVLVQESPKVYDGIIIPKKTVYEISKIIEETNKDIEIGFTKTKIKFSLDQITLTSKLVNANFPDYESVIPKNNNLVMITDCKSFAETIDRVSTISNEKFRTVKLEIDNNKCVVSSFGEEKSAGTEQISVDYSGPKININFNAKYILDVLAIIKTGNVSISFSSETAPTILKSSNNDNSLYLIMQMRA